MKANKSLIFMIATILIIFCNSVCSAASKAEEIKTLKPEPADLSLLKETKHTVKIACDYLIKSQLPDGSWKNDPAITSLVLYSLLMEPVYNPDKKTDLAVKKGFEYLEKFVQPDGGIYQKENIHYVTSVCLMAFAETGSKKYSKIISNAKNFLIKAQCDEGEGISRDHAFYGGIGYGGDDRPDLSNTHLALDAIKSAETYEQHYGQIIPANIEQAEQEEKELGVHWQKALVFLSRCQNVKAANKMPYATDDGGFIYETGTYKKERSHSYGSMTYAGVKSLLHARVTKDDIRVKRAVEWIKNNYTFEENPGFGTVSLYYYLMTASKCLDVLGDNVLVDNKGVKHFWREDLIKKLISVQKEEGCWQNESGRYWENVKDLATAYSLIAIKFAAKGL